MTFVHEVAIVVYVGPDIHGFVEQFQVAEYYIFIALLCLRFVRTFRAGHAPSFFN